MLIVSRKMNSVVGDSREVDCNVWGSGKWTELAGINVGIHRYVS